jgi:hypothetical protein
MPLGQRALTLTGVSVHGHEGHGEEGGQAGHIENVGPRLALELREEEACDLDQGEVVEQNAGLVLIQGRVLEAAVVADAGVVDEHRDRPALPGNPAGQCLGAARRGEIHVDALHPHAAAGGDIARDLREPGGGKGDEDQVHPQARALLGEGSAEALAGAGDEGELPGVVERRFVVGSAFPHGNSWYCNSM